MLAPRLLLAYRKARAACPPGRWIGVAGLALLVACATGPAPPLLSPIEVAHVYGYSERPLGDNRYEISYLGPRRRSLRSPEAHSETSAAERTQAFDFALWRAAQIALAQGFAGFRVSNVRTDTSTVVDNDYDPLYGPGPYPFRPWGRPWEPSWGPYWAPSPYAYEQTRVTFDVTLLQALGEGDYNAADVIAQLRQTYPGAEGAPAP
jgi:hypothetical protein